MIKLIHYCFAWYLLHLNSLDNEKWTLYNDDIKLFCLLFLSIRTILRLKILKKVLNTVMLYLSSWGIFCPFGASHSKFFTSSGLWTWARHVKKEFFPIGNVWGPFGRMSRRFAFLLWCLPYVTSGNKKVIILIWIQNLLTSEQ